MIVMLDNYDSFTYNLVQYLRMLGAEVKVVRNDVVSAAEILAWQPDGIVISPGPGGPESAGISIELIRQNDGRVPLLGVCLGHQAVAVAYGGQIVRARRLMHGMVSTVTTDGRSIFEGIRSPFEAMRYHSLAVARDSVPVCLEVTAESEDGEIMGLRHREQATEGIQFHPESIMTPVGKRLLRNFLNQTNGRLGKL